ncbi:MAG: hypothetical protein WCO23_02755 [bacterium]
MAKGNRKLTQSFTIGSTTIDVEAPIKNFREIPNRFAKTIGMTFYRKAIDGVFQVVLTSIDRNHAINRGELKVIRLRDNNSIEAVVATDVSNWKSCKMICALYCPIGCINSDIMEKLQSEPVVKIANVANVASVASVDPVYVPEEETQEMVDNTSIKEKCSKYPELNEPSGQEKLLEILRRLGALAYDESAHEYSKMLKIADVTAVISEVCELGDMMGRVIGRNVTTQIMGNSVDAQGKYIYPKRRSSGAIVGYYLTETADIMIEQLKLYEEIGYTSTGPIPVDEEYCSESRDTVGVEAVAKVPEVKAEILLDQKAEASLPASLSLKEIVDALRRQISSMHSQITSLNEIIRVGDLELEKAHTIQSLKYGVISCIKVYDSIDHEQSSRLLAGIETLFQPELIEIGPIQTRVEEARAELETVRTAISELLKEM